ncbi:hypothetical protein MPL1032_20368 [Mesorhizobium plurifarium]|uniref:Uncharacterized protein n=1 Tax=Mesorhizobium plurifarium TaxID=69974 RepID=A0A0K2VWM4_MESPL|nr:hypothetical protein MPL1032_20368 [Mesorhizobium plurifarium]
MDRNAALEPRQVAEDHARGRGASQALLDRGEAEAGADKAERGQRVVRLVGDIGHEAGFGAGRQELRAVGVAGLAHDGDPDAAVEVAGLDVGDTDQRIALRHCQHQRLAPHQHAFNIGVALRRRGIDETEVEDALPQILELRRRSPASELQMKIRPRTAEILQHRGNKPRMHRALDITDGEAACRATGKVAAELFQARSVGKQCAGFGEEGPALGVEMDALLGPLEQGDAQLLLELHDLPAQGRLRNVQLLGGAADIAGLGDGDEISYLAQVEHFSAPNLKSSKVLTLS